MNDLRVCLNNLHANFRLTCALTYLALNNFRKSGLLRRDTSTVEPSAIIQCRIHREYIFRLKRRFIMHVYGPEELVPAY